MTYWCSAWAWVDPAVFRLLNNLVMVESPLARILIKPAPFNGPA